VQRAKPAMALLELQGRLAQLAQLAQPGQLDMARRALLVQLARLAELESPVLLVIQGLREQ
jgi:hypothetical protein